MEAYGSGFQHPGQTTDADWTRMDLLSFKSTYISQTSCKMEEKHVQT